MEEQRGGKVEQYWWNTHSGTVKQRWWNSVVEQWNSDGGTVIVEPCGGKVEQCWWNTEVEEWNSGTVLVE